MFTDPLFSLYRGHQELVYVNKNRKDLLITNVMSNFPKKEKKTLWTVYCRFTLKTNVRLFLFT